MARKSTVHKLFPVLLVVFLFIGLIVAVYIIKNDRSLNPNSDAFFTKPLPKFSLPPETNLPVFRTPTPNPRFKSTKTSVPLQTQKPQPLY